MDRRQFCKIASLAAGALGLNGVSAFAATRHDDSHLSGQPALRTACPCRVTVLRRECHLDLQALYLDDPDSGPCRLLRPSDEFTFTAGATCPADFCPRLWDTICLSLADHAACSAPQDPSARILACPDGTRPVIVRIDILS